MIVEQNDVTRVKAEWLLSWQRQLSAADKQAYEIVTEMSDQSAILRKRTMR